MKAPNWLTAAGIAVKLAGIAAREKLKRNFQKWNRGNTGKHDDAAKKES